MDLLQIRQQYPEYSDLSDDQLARGLHSKFYADIAFDDFAKRVGITTEKPQETGGLLGGIPFEPREEGKPLSGAGRSFEREPHKLLGSEILGELDAAVTGGSIELGEMYARAGRVLGIDTTDTIEKLKEAKKPYDPVKKGVLWDSITQGVRSTVQSIGGGIPAGAIGTAIGGPVGAVGGFALGAGGLFTLSELDSFLEEAENLGIPREQVYEEAWVSALAEGGIEALTDLVGAKIFNLTGGQALKEPVKRGLKEAFKRFSGKVAKMGAVEVPGEMATSAIQAKERISAGIPSVSPTEAALQAVGPSAFQTVLMGGLAGGVSSRQQKEYLKAKVKEEKPQILTDTLNEVAKNEIQSARLKAAYQSGTLDLGQLQDLLADEPEGSPLASTLNDLIADAKEKPIELTDMVVGRSAGLLPEPQRQLPMPEVPQLPAPPTNVGPEGPSQFGPPRGKPPAGPSAPIPLDVLSRGLNPQSYKIRELREIATGMGATVPKGVNSKQAIMDIILEKAKEQPQAVQEETSVEQPVVPPIVEAVQPPADEGAIVEQPAAKAQEGEKEPKDISIYRQGRAEGNWWTPDKEYAESFGKKGKSIQERKLPKDVILIDEEQLKTLMTEEEKGKDELTGYNEALDRLGYDGLERLEEDMAGNSYRSYYLKDVAKLEQPPAPEAAKAPEGEKEKELWEMRRDDVVWKGYIPGGVSTDRALKGRLARWEKIRKEASAENVSIEAVENAITYEKERIALAESHRAAVESAISEGKIKSHPDYPDLKPIAAPEAEETEAKAPERMTQEEFRSQDVTEPAKKQIVKPPSGIALNGLRSGRVSIQSVKPNLLAGNERYDVVDTVGNTRRVRATNVTTGKSEYYHVSSNSVLSERNLSPKYNPWWEEAHRNAVETALSTGTLPYAEAEALGHFETYPELREQFRPKGEGKGNGIKPFEESVVQEVVYHGTGEDFDEIKAFQHFGTELAAKERLQVLETKKPRIISGYLDIKNPLTIDDMGLVSPFDIADWTNKYGFTDINMEEMLSDWIETLSQKDIEKAAHLAGYRDVSDITKEDLFSDFKSLLEQGSISQLNDWVFGGDIRETNKPLGNLDKASHTLVDAIEKAGYDGLVYRNAFEDKGKSSYVIFHSEQFKAKPMPSLQEPEKPAKAPEKAKPAQTYEDFAKEYLRNFRDMMKYTPDQAGSRIFAEKMADMADAHPDWVERIEAEEEEAAAKPAPKAEEQTPQVITGKVVGFPSSVSDQIKKAIDSLRAIAMKGGRTRLSDNEAREMFWDIKTGEPSKQPEGVTWIKDGDYNAINDFIDEVKDLIRSKTPPGPEFAKMNDTISQVKDYAFKGLRPDPATGINDQSEWIWKPYQDWRDLIGEIGAREGFPTVGFMTAKGDDTIVHFKTEIPSAVLSNLVNDAFKGEPGYYGYSSGFSVVNPGTAVYESGTNIQISGVKIDRVREIIEGKAKAEEQAPQPRGEEKAAEAYYSSHWDTKLKLGRKVDLVKKSGWVTAKGGLSKLGEKISESKWNDLSPAAQNVLKREIDRFYGKEVSEVSPRQEEQAEPDEGSLEAMILEARKWKGAAVQADALYDEEDKAGRLEHSRLTTKGDLDDYLIKKFDLSKPVARAISNELTAKNLKPDMSVSVKDYSGQPWADKALAAKKASDASKAQAKIDKKEADAKAKRDQEQADIEKQTALLKATIVKVPGIMAKTGKKVLVEDTAYNALNENSAKRDIYKELIDCLKS
jgi:hypothetical protein